MINIEVLFLFKNNANVDFAYYEKITKEIPLHAKQVESKNELYKKISKEIYWKENLTPIPSISKEYFKYFKLDKNEKSLFISSFEIALKGNDLNKNQMDIEEVFSFFKNCHLKIQITDLLDRYNKEVLVERMKLDKEFASIKKEINYSKTRAKNLEDLKNRFSFTQSININQLLDPKDNTSKYLPIATQLIAAYTDLNNLNEQLKRNKDQKDLLDIKEKFIFEYEILNKKNMPEAEKLNQIFKYFSEYFTNLEKITDVDFSRSEALKNLLIDLNHLKFINEFGFEEIGRENNYTINPIFLVSINIFLSLMLGIFVSFSLKLLKKYKKEKYLNKLEIKKSTSN